MTSTPTTSVPEDNLRSGTYFKRLSNRQIKRIYSRLPPCPNRNTIGCDLKNICLICDHSIKSLCDMYESYGNHRELEGRIDELKNRFRELNKGNFANKLRYYDNRIAELESQKENPDV